MSAPNVVWFLPVRFDATAYVVRVTINGVTEDLNFPASGTLTVGRDYWMTGDNLTDALETGSLVGRGDVIQRLFQATLRSHSQGAGVTATLDLSTWTMRCATGGIAFIKILWSHANTTLDPEIFGYTSVADSDNAPTIYSPNRVLGPVLFGRAFADDSREYTPIVGGLATSLSGIVRSSVLTSTGKRRREVLFRYLLESVALDSGEGSNPATWTTVEFAWLYAISKGWPFRHYTQASDVAVPVYDVYRSRSLEYPLSRDPDNILWWQARFELVREATTR